MGTVATLLVGSTHGLVVVQGDSTGEQKEASGNENPWVPQNAEGQGGEWSLALCVTVTNRKKPDSHRVRAEQRRNCELSGLIIRSLKKGVDEGVRKNTRRLKKRPKDEFSILVRNKDSLRGPVHSLAYAV